MVYERSDSAADLPENTEYPDNGCKLFKSCLKCPFPFCIYDMSYDGARLLKEWRNREIVRRLSAGASIKELELTFGISRSSIYQILKNNSRTYYSP